MSDGELLLKVCGLQIEGRADETWNPIINGASFELQKGEVMEEGAAEEIFNAPKNDYTKKLIAASFDLENKSEKNAA